MNERAIFMEALDKDSLAQRSVYLDEACGGHTGLRQRVEALLTSHEQAGSFLGKPVSERLAENLAALEGGQTKGYSPAGADGPEPLDFLAPSDKPGSLGRLGHYEVFELIGRGGMGVVLRAFDEKLHRVVAVKVMAPQLATNATARMRFVREARAAAAVRNEHVIGIHAVEEADKLPYLAMEYIAGVSLQERLDRSGPLELKEVLRIGIQTATGLAAAHAQGLIHRDIKPANILLENGVERVKITDFGLARAVDDVSLT
jgi:serine/threonine protein kinase